MKLDGTLNWALNQELKTGVANMVSQAWEKHERDRRLVSHVMEVMEADWWKSMSLWKME